jgi:hypothetical protein
MSINNAPVHNNNRLLLKWVSRRIHRTNWSPVHSFAVPSRIAAEQALELHTYQQLICRCAMMRYIHHHPHQANRTSRAIGLFWLYRWSNLNSPTNSLTFSLVYHFLSDSRFHSWFFSLHPFWTSTHALGDLVCYAKQLKMG